MADIDVEPLATVGGAHESNVLFSYGSPQLWLVDSMIVAYSDEKAPGRVVVADVLTGEGWSMDLSHGDGPGELGRHTPWVSSRADTIKLLTGVGRLSARLLDGTLLYDSLLTKQNRGNGGIGMARNSRFSVHVDRRVGGAISLRFESPQHFNAVQVDTIRSEEEAQQLPVRAFARGDLVVYEARGLVSTFDGAGRRSASRSLPWEVFTLTIDGSGRVWIQVYGHNADGYNLVALDQRLNTLGHAVIKGFQDAYGDYVISTVRDSLDVRVLTLSRMRWGASGREDTQPQEE